MPKNKPKILIIEDEDVMQQTLKSILKRDYDPRPVDSGFIGVEEVKKGDYSTILLDLCLPKMDGVETLKKIKEVDKNIPIIIFFNEKATTEILELMLLAALAI